MMDRPTNRLKGGGGGGGYQDIEGTQNSIAKDKREITPKISKAEL